MMLLAAHRPIMLAAVWMCSLNSFDTVVNWHYFRFDVNDRDRIQLKLIMQYT